MTELDWVAGSDPVAMLDYLAGKMSDRKMRLFACACARRFWSQFGYPTPRETIEFAEQLAEGTADRERVEVMRQRAEMWAATAPEFERFAYLASAATLAEQASDAARQACEHGLQQAASSIAIELAFGEDEARAVADASEAEGRAQVQLMNEVFGNPFKPVTIERHWLRWSGGAVVSMAQEIDDDQRFDELPYLADALMDAGCGDESLLRHLRRTSGHQRGCWALNAVLGRPD